MNGEDAERETARVMAELYDSGAWAERREPTEDEAALLHAMEGWDTVRRARAVLGTIAHAEVFDAVVGREVYEILHAMRASALGMTDDEMHMRVGETLDVWSAKAMRESFPREYEAYERGLRRWAMKEALRQEAER